MSRVSSLACELHSHPTANRSPPKAETARPAPRRAPPHTSPNKPGKDAVFKPRRAGLMPPRIPLARGHCGVVDMNDLYRSDTIRESANTFGREGKSVRIERFDPGPEYAAAVLLLHGADGLHSRGPSHREIARDLAANGLLGLLVHYFDRTGNVAASPLHFLRWTQVIEEAIDYAVRQRGLTGRRVGLVGFSLGAYLALAVAARDPRVGAVVDCVGGMPDLLASNVRA